jgi:hypothetical protein
MAEKDKDLEAVKRGQKEGKDSEINPLDLGESLLPPPSFFTSDPLII